jgi:uncharacterized protein
MKKAIQLYNEASNLGDCQAKNNLAICYKLGSGIQCDKKIAIKLYQEASDLGNSQAKNNLATCYEYGDGVELEDCY